MKPSIFLVYGFWFLLWSVLMMAIFVIPYHFHSPTLGDDLTRNTVRLSLLFYAMSAGLLLSLREQNSDSDSRRLARFLWTLAWLAYIVHLLMAFHHYHHWSHSDAIAHTREVSGVGEGIFVSHLFTLLWSLDVVWWWLGANSHLKRPLWVGRLLHGFMAFIIFNATVIFETGPIRWAGVVLFLVLGELLLLRLHRTLPEANTL